MKIVLLGPPGCGKGTQGEKLQKSFAIPHISSGDLLREAVSTASPLGVEAKGYMDSGRLVPDRLVLDLIRERVARDDCRDGFLLDGFPRTVEQANALAEVLETDGEPGLDHVIAIDVADEALVERLGARRSCPGCGLIFNMRFNPPAAEGLCDECGTELVLRDDDNEETIRARLAVYVEQTSPLIGFYRDSGLLRRVDGSGSSGEVSERISAAIQGGND